MSCKLFTGKKPSALSAMQRLATGEWFTSRISACGLFAGAYARTTGSQRADLRQLYGLLCRDETPMVSPSCCWTRLILYLGICVCARQLQTGGTSHKSQMRLGSSLPSDI